MNELTKLIDVVELESVQTTLSKITQLQGIIQKTLKPGHDTDIIPGTQKPTLLKPGAEKILMLLGLTSEYEIIDKVEDWEKGIFAYSVRCILSKDDTKITEGLGNCNSKEDKYRYRWVYESDIPVGLDKENLKKNNYGKYRIENDEIFSQVNTLLKMAKKRAQIDAVLTVASLSEIFTQDVEDMKEFLQAESIENMTLSDAEKMKILFGKYKGRTLGEVLFEDANYVKWVAENAKTANVKKAAQILLEDANKEIDLPIPEEDIPDMFKVKE